MTGTTNGTPKARSAIVLSVCVLVLFIAEAFWLTNWHRSNEELAIANARRAGQIGREQLQAINLLHEGFARNLTHSLGAYLRVVFTATLVSAEHLRSPRGHSG